MSRLANDNLDRFAKAIEQECAGCDPRDFECFRLAAAATLQALRTPSQEMINAADWTAGTADNGSTERASFVVEFQAAIDEALGVEREVAPEPIEHGPIWRAIYGRNG
jgi:hypothetical protein